MKKQSIKKIILIIAAIIISLLLITVLVPIIASYNDREKLVAYVESFGIWGAFVLLLIQIFQIVVAFIPGELVEFVSGTLYGTIWGLLICLAGIVVGEFLIFSYIKRLMRKNPDIIKLPKRFENAKFLKDEKKLEYVIFLLFFVPGIPKDMLTYFIPLTKIDIKKFLTISVVARIPSVISSTYAGATFADGNLIKTIATYAIIGIISLLGIYIHNKVINKGEKNG